MSPTATRTLFRTVAIAEAFSWALLLAAMFCKYVTESEPFGLHEGGVPVAGMIHGVVFIAYLGSSIASAVVFRWRAKTTILALASSIPPFFTYVFEVVADRKGLLGASAPASTTAG